MAGLITRLLGVLRNKQLAGVDKAGNIYYRRSEKLDGALVEKRWVKFKGDTDPTTLPVEWTSWLTGRRQEAPTPEEIMELEAGRNLVKQKAAILAKEEEKRCFRLNTLKQASDLDDLKPPGMDKFIQQVASREGLSFNGDRRFDNGRSSDTASTEENLRTIEPKGIGSSFQPGTWQPPK